MRTVLVLATLLLATSCHGFFDQYISKDQSDAALKDIINEEVVCHAKCIKKAIGMVGGMLSFPLEIPFPPLNSLFNLDIAGSLKMTAPTMTDNGWDVTVTEADIIPFPLGIRIKSVLTLAGSLKDTEYELQYKNCKVDPNTRESCTSVTVCATEEFNCLPAQLNAPKKYAEPYLICAKGQLEQVIENLKITLEFDKDLGGDIKVLKLTPEVDNIELKQPGKMCVNGEDKTERIQKEVLKIKGQIEDPINIAVVNGLLKNFINGISEEVISAIEKYLPKEYKSCLTTCMQEDFRRT